MREEQFLNTTTAISEINLKMAANDSGVDTSNDSTDGGVTNSMLTPPPSVMPPTPTSSPNMYEWSNFNLSSFHLLAEDRFALPHLPPLPLPLINNNGVNVNGNSPITFGHHTSTLPSGSHSYKMKSRSCLKNRFRFSYNKSESIGRKLRYASSINNTELVGRLLESGADPNTSDEYKRTPLHLAACRGYIHIMQLLLKYGANPNVIDSLGNTPLHLAIISASSNNFNIVVCMLLHNGASVHMFDRSGKTPLDLAEAKLRLLRTRYDNPTPETSKILEDMCMLTTVILRYMVKQQRELDDLSALEERLHNLSTSNDEKEVVSQTADELLASVERLSLNK